MSASIVRNIPCGAASCFDVEWRQSSALQSMALQVGSRLGHYDVTALIGEGGIGEVYKARSRPEQLRL